ncbi:hypothetical protein CAEBREN_12708 [Caenorhabditis brenneri]|uniref:Uncharacterized protein n=1 Tax=Caenorhabditis brenneri TaxID=135651 RepID=G0PE00_CAEBE|nr:hypothetical protein CAEBREN_12708 [Caenorhabditis brenneri]
MCGPLYTVFCFCFPTSSAKRHRHGFFFFCRDDEEQEAEEEEISTWFGSVSFSSNRVLIHDSFAKTTETIELSAPNDPIQQVVSTHLHVAILMNTGRIALRRIDDFERTPTILEPSPDETTLIVSTSKAIHRVQRDQKTSKIQKILEDSEGISEDVKHEVVGFPWPVRVVDAKGGNDFLMFLDSTGNLFSMGTGTRGELGVGLIRHVAEPVHIEQLAGIPIEKVVCGGWHTVALTTGGDVYAATEMYPVLFEEFPENIGEEEPVVQDIEVTEHTTTVYINNQKFIIGNDFVDITEFELK